jgi:hypothetical protein
VTFPFTPHTSFTDDATPAIGADFLNEMQAGLNAAARPIYWRKPDVSAVSTGGTTVTLGPGVPAFMVKDSVTSEFVSVEANGSVNVTDADLDTGSLAANTWYFVYGYAASGVIGYEISATAPTAFNLLYKTDDETRRYLLCFRTDGSGSIVPFRKCGNRYLYDEDRTLTLGGAGTSTGTTAWQTWSLTSYVDGGGSLLPPHVTWALLMTTTGSGNTIMRVRPSGTSYNAGGSPAARYVRLNAGICERWEMGTSAGQQIEVNVSGAVGYSISVDGFVEGGP